MTQSILIPLVAAGLLVAAVLGAFLVVRRDPQATTRRVQALFRKPAPPARKPDEGHYYKPYWS